ncbi:expressed unknown protein [Seminavis robusta]|uniref:Uncharacterized protein n=1 Tax=Seminavis robusta TaxID=568900 RepID=A0A9N8DAK4_9STRA|nr:expressed unknown protein [Seminavis robusta]|eukprot:Sro16_g011720.1 n/a (183) ;mRNA; r:79539-80087
MTAQLILNDSSSSTVRLSADTTTVSKGCMSSSTSNSRPRRRRRVGFSTLDIYEFEQVLGDHPGVSSGAPLALAPSHCRHHANIDIAFFEYRRKPRKTNKRELIESKETREEYLQRIGFTQEQIQQAANEAARIRRKRCKAQPVPDSLHIVWESITKNTSFHRNNGESASKLLQRHQEACRAA